MERSPLTKIICIDEFKASTFNGKICSYNSQSNYYILDILPSKRQTSYYFKQIFDSRLSVKFIVVDLFEHIDDCEKSISEKYSYRESLSLN